MNILPKSRTENIIVQDLRNEVLIYDTITNKAFCLNETAAKIFNNCDGKTSFKELNSKFRFTDELIFLALDELKKQELLERNTEYSSPLAGMNRREIIRKVGFATMIALPLISTIVAPTAANAASGGGTVANCQVCTSNTQCASGNCRTAFPNNGTSICAASAGAVVGQPGASFGVVDATTCSNTAVSQCCSGTGTFTTNLCTCN